MKMKKDHGYSLVEMLVTLAFVGIVSGSVLSLMMRGQKNFTAEENLKDAVQNVRLATETISRYLKELGNDCTGNAKANLISIGADQIVFTSDLNGNLGPNRGDPDGIIDPSFETFTISFSGGTNTAFPETVMLNGQPLAKNIKSLTFQGYDADNNPTGNPAQVKKIRITIEGETSDINPDLNRREAARIVSEVHLRNRSYTPFSTKALVYN